MDGPSSEVDSTADALRPWKSWKYFAKLLLTVVMLAMILRILDTERLWASLVDIDHTWLAMGIFASALFVVARFAKWIVLTRHNGLNAPIVRLLRATLVSLAFGIVTPGRLGEITSVAPFPAESRGRALLAYLFDRLGELFMVLLFSIPAAVIFFGWSGLLLSASTLLGVTIGILVLQVKEIQRRVVPDFLLQRIPKVQRVIDAGLRAPWTYWALCAFTYALAYAVVGAFVLGVQPISDWRAVATFPLVTLSNLISITVGGLGVREGLAASLGPLGGIRPEIAAGAFFLSFFFTRVVAGLVGLGWVALDGVHVAWTTDALVHGTSLRWRSRKKCASQSDTSP